MDRAITPPRTLRARLGSLPRRFSYAFAAAVLAMGAPVGLLLVRAANARDGLAALDDTVLDDPATFVYVTVSTLVAFTAFGYVLGRQADALIDLSLTDPLTGLRNKAAFDQRLAEEAARAARYAQPLSLLMIDVDGLKTVNDRAGHQAGDAALRMVVDALRQDARRTDLAARVGGDEFALIAPNTARPDAVALAERVRSLVAGQGAPQAVTASIGVATHGVEASTPGALVQAADAALYEAKRGGRNRVAAGPRPS